MSFSIISEVIPNSIATIRLTGELDSLSSREFQAEIEKIAVQNPSTVVLYMEELAFMSSAGLRVLIFAKQKMGTRVQLILVKPQEMVVDTLDKTGLLHSVTIVETY